MTTSIHTLIPDIYELLRSGRAWLPEPDAQALGLDIGRRLSEQFNRENRKPTLRMSKLGPQCSQAVWYSIHRPDLAAPLQPWVLNKFAYGHILEAWVVALAKAAGHRVEGEQDELIVDGIVGHRDCVIDGRIVDVKSAASQSLGKFETGSIANSDTFGYLDQLDAYMVGSLADPLVEVKDKGYLLAIDKQLGHLALHEHTCRPDHIRQRIADYKAIVALDRPPPCTCETVSDGEGGNVKLGVRASYSDYKFVCWPHLRTALYAKGPVFFTHVSKWPWNKDGPLKEVDKHGKSVYH